MNILLLGKGYIGTALYQELTRSGHFNVNWASKADCGYDDPSRLERVLCNVYYQKAYDVVINASGYTGRPNVDACEDNKDDTWYYNVKVPGMIARMCNTHDIHLVHISSGCIFDGYQKEFCENDEPNFGLCNLNSSWYSKTKHAGELAVENTGATVLRIRMPFCNTLSDRNILMKLLKYDNIINQTNSMTNVEDLVLFISSFLHNKQSHWGETYNVVNSNPIPTSTIINMLKLHGLDNVKWKYINLDQLYDKTKAHRSNCVLSTKKIQSIDMSMPDTNISLSRCIKSLKNEMVQA